MWNQAIMNLEYVGKDLHLKHPVLHSSTLVEKGVQAKGI